MAAPDDSVWIAVTSDGTVTAWDSVDAARNHLRNESGDVWVEHVTINRTTTPQDAAGAPPEAGDDEDAPDGPPTTHNAPYRRTWMAAPRLIYPERPRGETA